eukprot:2602648-Rhodomonas_salina.2
MTWAGRTAGKATRRPRNNQAVEGSGGGEEERNVRERKKIVAPYHEPLRLYQQTFVVVGSVEDSTVIESATRYC